MYCNEEEKGKGHLAFTTCPTCKAEVHLCTLGLDQVSLQKEVTRLQVNLATLLDMIDGGTSRDTLREYVSYLHRSSEENVSL